MNFLRLSVMGLFASTTLLISCTPKESEVGSYTIPQVAGPVGSASAIKAKSVKTASTSLLLSNSSACDSCSNTAQQAFQMAANFVEIGKGADTMACFAKALINGGHVKTDGTETFIDLTDSLLKVSAQATGTVLTSYKIYACNGATATLNSTYISGTVGTDGTTSINLKTDSTRDPSPSDSKASLTVGGRFLNGAWQEKTITMNFAITNYIGQYEITQQAGSMILKGSTDSTVDHQVYGKFDILGDSPTTYALDAGSAKLSIGGGADAIDSWDSNGLAGGSQYASEVSSATYLPTPVFSGAISGDESWSCTAGEATVLNQNSVSAATIAAIQACVE